MAAASALADAGAHVALAARTATEIAEAADPIRSRGQQAYPLTLDVSDVDAVSASIAAQAPFDILVNNAGTNRRARAVVCGREGRRFRFRVRPECARRLFRGAGAGAAAYRSTEIRLYHQHFVADGPCRRDQTRTVYCATKHAMEGFTKAMAIELAPHKIRVNTLAPTFIETPMTRPFFRNEAFRKDALNRIKLGQLGQLEDLTGAILASDAAALMTGTSLVVDGGWTVK